MRAILGPGRSAEGLEGVEVGVGAEQVGVARGDQRLEPLLQRLALGAHLGEPGGEDHRERGPLLEHGLEHLDRLADQDDGQVEVARDVEHRAVAGHAVDLVAVGVDRVAPAPGLLGPGPDLAPHGGVGSRVCRSPR